MRVNMPKNEAMKVLRGKTMTTRTFGMTSSSVSFAKGSTTNTDTATKRMMTFIPGNKTRTRGKRNGRKSTNSS